MFPRTLFILTDMAVLGIWDTLKHMYDLELSRVYMVHNPLDLRSLEGFIQPLSSVPNKLLLSPAMPGFSARRSWKLPAELANGNNMGTAEFRPLPTSPPNIRYFSRNVFKPKLPRYKLLQKSFRAACPNLSPVKKHPRPLQTAPAPHPELSATAPRRFQPPHRPAFSASFTRGPHQQPAYSRWTALGALPQHGAVTSP